MIRVLIIEDEVPARNKLKRFLKELEEPIIVVAEIGTAADAIEFLKSEKEIDLILSDIELQDGNAFEIYKNVPVSCPIIFTTAYNQFLMDAFESNGIEYLLKPFSLERFMKAWQKFLLLRKSPSLDNNFLVKLNQMAGISLSGNTFKKRFAVNTNKGTYFLEVEDIIFFTAEEGVVFAIDRHSKKHLLPQNTLKEIEALLDEMAFFRINRSELVHKKYISRIERYSKNNIAIKLEGYEKHLVTSQSSTGPFREWVEK